jgi:CheY-like chemotaxis protein
VSDRKILLADDSPTIQKVVNLTFADEGIDVVCAGDGDSAYQMLSEFTPDVVLADVNMPGKNGYELCQALRERDETRQTPVILLVGSFEPFDEERAFQVGATDYLTKPFQSIRQLVNAVSGLIEKRDASEVTFEEASAPAETEPHEEEGAPQAEKALENEDIDSLYRQSLLNTVELPKDIAATSRFSDIGEAGIDDELIETQFADSPTAGERSTSSDSTSFLTPLDTGDWKSDSSDDSSDSTQYDDTIREEYPTAESSTDEEIADGQQLSAPFSDEESSEMPLEEPRQGQIATQEFDSGDNVFESFTEFTPPLPETAYSNGSLTENQTEEADVLDLPDTGHISSPSLDLREAPTYDESTQENRADEVSVPQVPESEVPVRGDSNSASAELSPQMIDAIADRVADKIAESLARHLAKQVVPEVVRIMEEDKKNAS